MEVYSVDEGVIHLPPDVLDYSDYGRYVARTVRHDTGIPVSVGIAPTKTLAKIASRFAKKWPGYRGACVIDTEEKRTKALHLFEVGDVWGIGRRMLRRLEAHDVHTAWDFTQCRESWVRQQFTVTGLRTWKELRGFPCIELDQQTIQHSLCTSRSFPDRGVADKQQLEEAVANFAAECARRLRSQQTAAGQLLVFAYTSRFRTDDPSDMIQQSITFPVPTHDARELIQAALQALRIHYKEGEFWYKKAGVVCYELVPAHAVQTNLFDKVDRVKQRRLLEAIDEINRKNGDGAIRVAAQGTIQRFGLKSEYLSPQYTTNLDDIIPLKL